MIPGAHPLKKMLASQPPHILVRKLDKEEDYFVAISIFMDGRMRVLSNDGDRAREFLEGLVLGFPPSFKERSDLNLIVNWRLAGSHSLFSAECSPERWDGTLCTIFRDRNRAAALQFQGRSTSAVRDQSARSLARA
jgi:hypothetical protein